MIGRSITPIVVDTDNALGRLNEKFFPGDVDDAFALAYLINTVPIQSIYSVGGNASAKACHQNNVELLKFARTDINCIQGLDKKNINSELKPARPRNCDIYLSLGPLTNLSYFLKHNFYSGRVWMTLGRIKTNGFLPPIWPMEFNGTEDLQAFEFVIRSGISKTIVPLDIAIQLRFHESMSQEMSASKVGQYLLANIKRWQLRNWILKGRRDFPVWDLVSAMALTHPQACTIQKGKGYLFKNGLFLCDVHNEPQSYHDRRKAVHCTDIDIVTGIDQEQMWKLFFKALQSPAVNPV